MYQDINILSIENYFTDRKIIVFTNFDIDPTTVNNENIILFDKSNSTEMILDFIVKGKNIEIFIKEEVSANVTYIFKIQNIKNVIGEKITSGITKEIVFESSIKEIPNIISPSEYEELSKLVIKMSLDCEVKYNFKYAIQISNDMAFINSILETSTIENSIALSDIPDGQYFLRARIENENVGRWSEIRSFIFKKIIDEDDSEPSYEEDIVVTIKPEDGETPKKICIYFSGDIYNSDDTIISITRRGI